MKKLDLAVLPAGTPLVDAYSTMRESGRSAIVTVQRRQPGVITADQIVRAIRAGKSSLDELSVRRVEKSGIVTTPVAAPGRGVYRTVASQRASGNRIQLVTIGADSASIVVNDSLARKYTTFPAGCRCAKGDHYWDPWEAPRICPEDQTKVDCGPGRGKS